LFFALSAIFLFSGLGLGLLWGTVAENLQQALLLSFFTLLPVMVVSGVIAPVESMPRPIQLLSLLSPLTYYLEIGLGIFLKGVGLEVLWPRVLAIGWGLESSRSGSGDSGGRWGEPLVRGSVRVDKVVERFRRSCRAGRLDRAGSNAQLTARKEISPLPYAGTLPAP
jgi:hypothetical protein